MTKFNINTEWENFLCKGNETEEPEKQHQNQKTLLLNKNSSNNNKLTTTPQPTDIYISTKTMIVYLNEHIELSLFWDIPVIPYHQCSTGVIKKQMKLKSFDSSHVEAIQTRLLKEENYKQHILCNINNPNGRIKFKDIRNISIGLCKKDIQNTFCKGKKGAGKKAGGAFSNCFILILRVILEGNVYKEIHVKVFNTGKLEIPGIQSNEIFEIVLSNIIAVFQPFYPTVSLFYRKDTTQTVLINSNFNAGFYIHREKLYDILKNKYKIQCMYDSCSYPGIQCKFHYDQDYYKKHQIIQSTTPLLVDTTTIMIPMSKEDKLLKKKERKNNYISYMIFRTGSILIVGKCDEAVLRYIYSFLKQLLIDEYPNIIHDYETFALPNKKPIKKKEICRETRLCL